MRRLWKLYSLYRIGFGPFCVVAVRTTLDQFLCQHKNWSLSEHRPRAKLGYILILPWKQFCRLSSLREGFFFGREVKRKKFTRGKEDQGFRLLAPPCPHLGCQPTWSLLIIAVKEHGKEFFQRVIWKQSSLTSRCLLNNEYSRSLLASSRVLFSNSMQVSLLVLISCFYLARPWESSVSL